MRDYRASDRVNAAVSRALKEDRPFEAGRLLASELDKAGATTVDLMHIAKEVGTSLRTIRYAVQAYRFATRVGLSESDVERIGWTNFALVTSGANVDMTKSDVITMCEGRTVQAVRAELAGMAGAVTAVTFALNKSQRRELEAALVRHGAVRVGRGLSGKEAALMKIISKSASQ